MPNKRGRLSSGTTPLSRDQYSCVIEKCEATFRGDSIAGHFRKNSKIAVLEDARKLDVSGERTNGLNHINTLLEDENQRKHTVFLLINGYSSENLPNFKSEGFKKRKELPSAFSLFKPTSAKVYTYLVYSNSSSL